LGLNYTQISPQLYLPAEHIEKTGYILISKIKKYIFSTNLHYHTQGQLLPTNLNLVYHNLA